MLRFLVFLGATLVNGCYRSADVQPSELRTLRVDASNGSAVAVHQNGDTLTVDDYDTVVVESRSAEGAVGPDGSRSGVARSEFEGPVSATLSAKRLAIEDSTVHRDFDRDDVEELTFFEYAPERPWIVAGVTVGVGILGGVLGWASGGSCSSDVDFDCMDNAIHALVGAPLGVVAGFAISLPRTGNLGHWERAHPATGRH